ncbi:MAG: redoxin domain-containing protein [Acidimicrobiia bacterium]|nr:redoxin domain-containing protein [Acidimicrobiia bacterium]
MTVTVGERAPAFTLVDQDRNPVSSESLAGSKAIIVFIPFPFTGTCESELCDLRDRLNQFERLDASVVAITCDTAPTNKAWSDANAFGFPVLSDFWPHGATAQAYGVFNDALGCANRSTFVLDEDGVISAVITSDSLGIARESDHYLAALEAIEG